MPTRYGPGHPASTTISQVTAAVTDSHHAREDDTAVEGRLSWRPLSLQHFQNLLVFRQRLFELFKASRIHVSRSEEWPLLKILHLNR